MDLNYVTAYIFNLKLCHWAYIGPKYVTTHISDLNHVTAHILDLNKIHHCAYIFGLNLITAHILDLNYVTAHKGPVK